MRKGKDSAQGDQKFLEENVNLQHYVLQLSRLERAADPSD